MTKKKSKYRPRPLIYDTMNYVKVGNTPVADTGAGATQLFVINRDSLEEILKGRGTKWHVDTLIEVFNLCEALAMMRMGHDWMEEIHQAQDAIFNMARRGVKTGSFVFTGPEMAIVKTIMELHEEQLKQCTVNQLDDAIKLVKECKRLKKARQIVEAA
jgi:hypothetical protein